MQPDASLSWLALGLTPGLASRLSARVLRRFDSPEGVFRASLPDLESCHLPTKVAQAIAKKESFKRAEKELAGIQKIACCTLLNWTEPEYPQSLLQIYDPPVLLYVRGDPQVLNLPALASSAHAGQPSMARKWLSVSAGNWPRADSLSLGEWRVELTPSGIRQRWIPMTAPLKVWTPSCTY